jgi:hypothetical protein
VPAVRAPTRVVLDGTSRFGQRHVQRRRVEAEVLAPALMNLPALIRGQAHGNRGNSNRRAMCRVSASIAPAVSVVNSTSRVRSNKRDLIAAGNRFDRPCLRRR